MTDNPNVTVAQNETADRYEIRVDGAVAGFTSFQESETHIAFTHTEVDARFKGQGLASRLAADVIADAVARDLVIIPLCPYLARYLERHEIDGARVEWPNRPPRP